MVCLASSAVRYEPSGEAGGASGIRHQATLLLQLTEPNNETQRRGYQEPGVFILQRREPKLSLVNDMIMIKLKWQGHPPVQREKSFISA